MIGHTLFSSGVYRPCKPVPVTLTAGFVKLTDCRLVSAFSIRLLFGAEI